METIYIQQDKVSCHISPDDEIFCKVASGGGFYIPLICRPPNSHDLNVLDLGLFSAVQSLHQQEVTRSIDQLIEVLQKLTSCCSNDWTILKKHKSKSFK